MTMLSDQTSNVLITGGVFTTVEGGIHVHAPEINTKALKTLHKKTAPGAFHNSAERYDPPKCHPHTRRAVLREIIDWTENDGVAHPFLWMYGPAGSGKSSIAQTIAEQLYKEGKLAATFFFARTAAGRNTADRLIATIAYQLTLSIPKVSTHILEAIGHDPAIFSKSLDAQLEVLIIEPLSQLRLSAAWPAPNTMPRLIIIDGLDECKKPEFQRLILTVLFAALRRSQLPFFFLIASRPEPEIRKFFNQETSNILSRPLVLDDKYKPDVDIEVFLRSRFDDIKRCHPLGPHLPSIWPSNSDIGRLVTKASGQFIYASTVIKFVESPQHRPMDRLDIIFGLSSPGSNTPFAELDALYLYIFSSAADAIRVVETFAFIILRSSGFYASTDLVEDFFYFQRGDLQIILNDLHSIIHVPNPGQSSNALHLFHASLADFLQDKTRSERFFVDSPENHEKMARLCIKHMRSSNTPNPIIRNVSCTGLMIHCPKSRPTQGLLEDLYKFDFKSYLVNMKSLQKEVMIYLPPFWEWIRYQVYSSEGNDLTCRYQKHLDQYLKAVIQKYLETPELSYLVTASMLDNFQRYCSSFLNTLSIALKNPHQRHNLGELDMASLQFSAAGDRKFGDYHKLIVDFLTDETRSGSQHVGKSRFKDLALLFIDILYDPPFLGVPTDAKKEMRLIEECCLDVLLDVLPRIPMDSELAKRLSSKQIPQNTKYITNEKKNAVTLVIQSYIEAYTRHVTPKRPIAGQLFAWLRRNRFSKRNRSQTLEAKETCHGNS